LVGTGGAALVVVSLLLLREKGPPAAHGELLLPVGATSAGGAAPAPVEPAFVPGKPRFLQASKAVSRWAVVRTAVAARARPDPRGAKIMRVETRTPEVTTNIVLVLGSRVDEAGDLWIRIRLAALGEPNTGWVPREALGGYGTVTTHLVVDVDSLEATLFRKGRAIFRAHVGVGKSPWPTPRGEFYIRNKLTGYASPMYGPLAFGTSARSAVLTDWPAGGFVGIHGTDRPELLPGRVSHGCIRLRNEDILRLAELMPVGTPLTVR
jgi:L,D-transpeptidase catalytic domain